MIEARSSAGSAIELRATDMEIGGGLRPSAAPLALSARSARGRLLC
jgi:hypothetical protein